MTTFLRVYKEPYYYTQSVFWPVFLTKDGEDENGLKIEKEKSVFVSLSSVTLGARDFSSVVFGFQSSLYRDSPLVAFGRNRKFPSHARKTSVAQGKAQWSGRNNSQKCKEVQCIMGRLRSTRHCKLTKLGCYLVFNFFMETISHACAWPKQCKGIQ